MEKIDGILIKNDNCKTVTFLRNLNYFLESKRKLVKVWNYLNYLNIDV